jgi:hypothetical protein
MSFDSIACVLISPIRFFEARSRRRPNWAGAAVPVVTQCVLAGAIGTVVSNKGQAAITTALAQFRDGNGGDGGTGLLMTAVSAISVLFNVLRTMFFFAVSVGAVIVLDILFAQSGRVRRLVEFTGYSYWPTVAWSVVTLAVLVFWCTPAEMSAPSLANMNDVGTMVANHQVRLASTPIQITLRIIASFFWGWQIAIQAAALRVVSGFTVAGAWASGIVLISVL